MHCLEWQAEKKLEANPKGITDKWTILLLVTVGALIAIFFQLNNIQDGIKISFTVIVENNVSTDDLDTDAEYTTILVAGIKQFFEDYFEKQSYTVKIVDDVGTRRDFQLSRSQTLQIMPMIQQLIYQNKEFFLFFIP